MSVMQENLSVSTKRLVSLDAFRGFTIALMIVVNDPGSWSYIYHPLDHAAWHGITPTDFVFPFFLFIVGVSIVLAYNKRLKLETEKKGMYRKIWIRSLKIFAVGLFLWLFPGFEFGDLRFPGVLQRIAIVFLVCSLLFLNSDWKKQAWIAGLILLGYWFVMALVPVPIDEIIRQALITGEVMRQGGLVSIGDLTQVSDGMVAANLHEGTNLAAYLDRLIIPGPMWEENWDPEGILSTFPAIVTGITGMLVGKIIVSQRDLNHKVLLILIAGFLSFTLGSFWSWFFPLNKNLWTSSFVLYTSGLAALVLGVCLYFIDGLGHKKWARPGVIFGSNAITIYVIAGMLPALFAIPLSADTSLQSAIFTGMVQLGLAPELASFLYALLFTGLCYIPAYILYKKKIFIKL
ncbi:MAG: acyltransferase family protein [Candidatus Cyclobacteriaceae bacterium M3_2C_046]